MCINSIEDLRVVEAFKSANQKTLEALAACCEVRSLGKGEHIFYDKEECSKLYIVLRGFVTIYKMNSHGEKKVVFILDKGKMINEVVLQGLPASISCEAFEKSEILCCDNWDFVNIMEQDFELTKGVLTSLSLKNRRLYRQLKNTSNSVRGDKRVAAKLWKLSEDYGMPCKSGICINLDISITYLADMLGSQRETVSRQIKTLTEKELISIQSGKIIINNRDALANYFKSS